MNQWIPSVLLNYGFAITHLREWEELVIYVKKTIGETFGLTKENNYRRVFDVPDIGSTESLIDIINFPELLNYIVRNQETKIRISEHDIVSNTITYTDNDRRVTSKLSKFLSNYAVPESYLHTKVLPKLNATGFFDHQVTDKNWITDMYSLNKKMYGFISINPEDFLINSNFSWSNCYRLPSVSKYNSSGIFLGLNQNTFMGGMISSPGSFEREDKVANKFIGRFWIYLVIPEFYPRIKYPAILIQKNYGSIPEQNKQIIQTHIQEVISKKYGISNKWTSFKSREYAGELKKTTSVFFDNGQIKYIIHEDDKNFSEANISLDFSTGICLQCGNFNSILYRGKCKECGQYDTCFGCGRILFDGCEMRYSEIKNRLLCEECLSKNYVRCGYCDGWHDNSEGREVRGYCWVCNTCLTDLFFRCEECGATHHKDHLKEHKGKKLCSNCFCMVETWVCSQCNQEKLRGEFFSENICMDCFKNNYEGCCGRCNAPVLKGSGAYEDRKHIDGSMRKRLYCNSCAEYKGITKSSTGIVPVETSTNTDSNTLSCPAYIQDYGVELVYTPPTIPMLKKAKPMKKISTISNYILGVDNDE